MERLTDRFDDKTTIGVINVFANDDLIDIPEYIRGPIVTASICNAIEKLAEYEDTGLAPDEIHKLNDFEQSQMATLLKEKAILLKEHFELRKERNYWEREAKGWASELGEQKLERGKYGNLI